MSSHGIANVSNSVHSNDNRIGVPNVFVRRATLEARTLEEARDRGLLAARARGTNQFFADTGGRLWDLETSATAHAFMDHTEAGFMAHSNHYVSQTCAYQGHRAPGRPCGSRRSCERGSPQRTLDLVPARCAHEPSLDQCICGTRVGGARPTGHDVGDHHDLDERVSPRAPDHRARTYVVFEMDGA
jgi:hypothetical protein